MKAIKILVIVLVGLGALLVGGALYANSYVQNPEFEEEILTRARAALGSEIEIEEIDISIFSGVTLRSVVVPNPRGFRGNFLTAEEVVLRHRLLPLLAGHLKLDELTLEKPFVRLARNASNVWNFQKFGAHTTRSVSTSAPGADDSSSNRAAFDIAVSEVSINDGDVEVVGRRNERMTKMQGVDLTTSLNFIDDKPDGSGRLSVETLTVGDSLFVKDFTSPLEIAGDKVKLAPMSGDLAGGRLAGEATLQLEPQFKYFLNVRVDNSDVNRLLQEAGARRTATGRLRAATEIEGTGGLPTMKGKGRIDVVDGKLVQTPLQRLVATLLQIPALGDIEFSQALVEFSLARNVMKTPVVRITSPEAHITANGSIALATKSLNHRVTLGIPEKTLRTAPGPVLFLFTEKAEGYHTLKFRLSGPYNSPRTDLQRRLMTAPAQKLLDKGLKRLFGRK